MHPDDNVGLYGFVCGAFDLLHPGHLHLLEKAASMCDALVVGLHVDPTINRPDTKNKPAQSTFERYYQIASLHLVEAIIPYDTEKDLENMLAVYPISKRFLGSDYQGKDFTAKKLCEDRGIEMVYIPRLHSWSSSELRSRVRTSYTYEYNIDDLLRGPQ